ncbi:hypothetical protein CK203_028894 [Vitis vinifera]|uniref:Uncharacterized protein n=1 Tax=Vitis vinifera TaxID=29760 RepID=A0A438IAE9_VITVI|nr:hypothetical protein CK203_028894 [Vitis vinifera]
MTVVSFMGVLLPRLSPPFHPYKFFILSYVQLGEMVLSWRQTWRIPSSPGAFYSDVSPTHWGITNTPSFNEGTLTLQTSEIEISDVSQLKQLAMIPHNLFIKNCDSVESLLEDEFLQTNMLTNFAINGLKGLEKLCISISEGDPTSLHKLEIDGCSDLVYIQLPLSLDVPFDSQLFQAQIVGAYPFISAEAEFRGLSRIVVSQRGLAFQPT